MGPDNQINDRKKKKKGSWKQCMHISSNYSQAVFTLRMIWVGRHYFIFKFLYRIGHTGKETVLIFFNLIRCRSFLTGIVRTWGGSSCINRTWIHKSEVINKVSFAPVFGLKEDTGTWVRHNWDLEDHQALRGHLCPPPETEHHLSRFQTCTLLCAWKKESVDQGTWNSLIKEEKDRGWIPQGKVEINFRVEKRKNSQDVEAT